MITLVKRKEVERSTETGSQPTVCTPSDLLMVCYSRHEDTLDFLKSFFPNDDILQPDREGNI